MVAAVAWISVTPVKGLRLQARDEVQVTEDGVPGDRAFFLVDERGAMVSATRIGPLVSVVAVSLHSSPWRAPTRQGDRPRSGRRPLSFPR